MLLFKQPTSGIASRLEFETTYVQQIHKLLKREKVGQVGFGRGDSICVYPPIHVFSSHGKLPKGIAPRDL
jgi:hypothetical protein